MRNYLAFVILFLFYYTASAQEAFTTIWTLPGGQTNIQFFCERADTANYTWETVPADESGSGFFESGDGLVMVSCLPQGKTVIISISPENLRRFYTFNDTFAAPDNLSLIDVLNWGSTQWSSMKYAFFGCRNLNITATDIPDMIDVKSMQSMFYICNTLNGPANINDWDVSSVENMTDLFLGCYAFNQDVSAWDVSNVKRMNSIFLGCHEFNQNISSWDVSGVTDMYQMFTNAGSFNQDLSSWDVSKVSRINRMFLGTREFNGKLPAWNFDIINDLSSMFADTWAFNQDISSWDLSNVLSVFEMFAGARAFNQDLSSWDVSNVRTFTGLFKNARDFNHDLGNWDIGNASGLVQILDNSGIDCYNYSTTLEGWFKNPGTPPNQTLGAEGMIYSTSAEDARDGLISKGWTIAGDSAAGHECYPAGISSLKFSDLKTWPNPFKEKLCFDISADEKFKYKLINLSGTTILSGMNIFIEDCINTSDLIPGLYILNLNRGFENYSVPVVKK